MQVQRHLSIINTSPNHSPRDFTCVEQDKLAVSNGWIIINIITRLFQHSKPSGHLDMNFSRIYYYYLPWVESLSQNIEIAALEASALRSFNTVVELIKDKTHGSIPQISHLLHPYHWVGLFRMIKKGRMEPNEQHRWKCKGEMVGN